MPIATASQATTTVEDLKSRVGTLTLESPVNLAQYEQIQNSPSIGTEFRSYSKKGKPVLTIREVLKDDAKIAALGRLV